MRSLCHVALAYPLWKNSASDFIHGINDKCCINNKDPVELTGTYIVIYRNQYNCKDEFGIHIAKHYIASTLNNKSFQARVEIQCQSGLVIIHQWHSQGKGGGVYRYMRVHLHPIHLSVPTPCMSRVLLFT